MMFQNSRKFYFPLVQQFHTMCTITMLEIGSFRRLEYYGFDPVIWKQRSLRVTLCGVECASRILARKLHGWLGFRTEQGEPFPRRRLLCVVRSFDIPVYTRETRYAEWILTRRNCTHNCDAIRSIITFDSIINVGHLFESRTR